MHPSRHTPERRATLDRPAHRPHIGRRAFLVGATSAGLFLAAGCAARQGASTSAPAQTSGGGTFPATVTHRYGKTEIKQAPTRVLSLGYTDHDVLLALGIVPIGVQQWIPSWQHGVGPWAEPMLGATGPELFKGQEIDLERVAGLRPDLIVAVQRAVSEAEYQTLARVAPTVVAPEGFVPFGVPWQDQASLIGQALGQETAIKQQVDGVTAKTDETRRANPSFAGKTIVAAMPSNDGQYFAYSKQDPRVRFLESLGFALAPAVDVLEQQRFYSTISRERLDLLEADVLVFIGSSVVTLDSVKADDLLKKLEVSKRGDVVMLEEQDVVMAFSSGTVLSIPYALERFVPKLAAVTT